MWRVYHLSNSKKNSFIELWKTQSHAFLSFISSYSPFGGKVCVSQTTWECEWFVAHFASVRHPSGMGHHVCLQILRSRKGLPTIITFVRLLACVDEHVFLQVSMLQKWFLADFAFVCFLCSVSSHVRHQSSIHSKWLVADFTLVWFVSSVNYHVLLQVPFKCKWLVANFALVLLWSRVS